MALRVLPLGPRRRCRRLTNFSLLLTVLPILMMSQATSSSRIRTAWGKGTDRARSLIRSRALMMMYGSQVLRVVRTDMVPSTRFSSHLSWCCGREGARGAVGGRGGGRG